jgi:hypothetical protein
VKNKGLVQTYTVTAYTPAETTGKLNTYLKERHGLVKILTISPMRATMIFNVKGEQNRMLFMQTVTMQELVSDE